MLMFFYPHEMRPDEQAQKFHIDDLAYGYPDLGSASDPIEVCRGGHPLPTHQFWLISVSHSEALHTAF